MATKPTKPTKIHDISQPGTKAPSPTSRPIIISSRPVLKDPMMVDTEAAPTLPDSSSPAEVPAVSKKIRIEPIHADLNSTDDATKDDTLPEPGPESVDATTEDNEPAVLILDPAPTVELASDTAKKDELEKTPEKEPALAEESTEIPAAASRDEPTTGEKKEKTEDKPAVAEETVTENKPEAEESAEATEHAKEPASGDLANLDVLDEAAVKEARAAAERQHAFDQLVEQETYFLPINAAEKRRMKRTLLVLLLVFVVLLAAVAIDLLLDAGLISLGNLQPLTDFIHS